MKKTLFIAALAAAAPLQATVYDYLRPAAIITAGEGESISYSASAGAQEALAIPQNSGATTANRTAVVKEGTGTMVIDTDVSMAHSLVLREGTTVIRNATLTNLPKLESPNLSVGGHDAVLVLDNGHYDHHVTSTGYVSAIAIGGQDGDGSLILRNGSTMSNAHDIFMGMNSVTGVRDTELTQANWTSSHIAGSYTSTDTGSDELYRRKAYFADAPADAGEDASFYSRVTVQVESGSRLQAGQCLYMVNGDFTVTGEGSLMADAGRNVTSQDSNNIGGVGLGDTATYAHVTVADGAAMRLVNETEIAYFSGGARVDVTGEGSLLSAQGRVWNSVWSKATADINTEIHATEGGRLEINEMLMGGSTNDGHAKNASLHIGEGSSYEGQNLIMYANAAATVDAGGRAALSLLLVNAGAELVNNGTLQVDQVSYSFNPGDGKTYLESGTVAYGTVSGNGTFSELMVLNNGTLLVEGSGRQSYTGNLTLGGKAEFRNLQLLTATMPQSEEQPAVALIDMQGQGLYVLNTATLALNIAALADMGSTDTFTLVLAENIGNTADFTDSHLAALLARTDFTHAEEVDAALLSHAGYALQGSTLVFTNDLPATPEPATSTLALAALAGLLRRRR